MNLKLQAAAEAINYIENGMTLGLGSGSTVNYFLELLGKKLSSGELKDVQGVPSSEVTAMKSRQYGVPLTTLSKVKILDLTIDGADEVDSNLNLIKGLGHALLREKILAVYSKDYLIIVDETKLVNRLGEKKPLPVEIIKFEAEIHINWLETLGCKTELYLTEHGTPIETDNGNYIALCRFQNGIENPLLLAEVIKRQPGIVEHGLFLNMARHVIVSTSEGLRVLERKNEI